MAQVGWGGVEVGWRWGGVGWGGVGWGGVGWDGWGGGVGWGWDGGGGGGRGGGGRVVLTPDEATRETPVWVGKGKPK